MKKIYFTKMVASGNDFIVVTRNQSTETGNFKKLATELCDRKYGIGADGLLVLENSKIADIKMRIFNADGSEAGMCGNGARCTALYVNSKLQASSSKLIIETKAGLISAKVSADKVRIRLTDPKDIKIGIPIKINSRNIKVNFINTGVPHTVIFVEGIDKIDVVGLGEQIRNHQRFMPAGTNVDFVEVLGEDSIQVRTYERGVEDETLACGTGSVAAAIITAYSLARIVDKINVHTKSGEILKVYFDRSNSKFQNIWLEGKAKIVYRGEYYV